MTTASATQVPKKERSVSEQSISDLREKAGHIQREINRIESEARSKASAAVLGKCFKYKNFYSCPKTNADYWWLYTRVTAVDKTGWLRVFRFQTDTNGQTTIDPNTLHISANNLGEQITLRQFQHAWKGAARMLNSKAMAAMAAKAYVP